MSARKILIAQGGGPTAVINQSLVGVVLAGKKNKDINKIYGAVHGVRGIVNQDFVDLNKENNHHLNLIAKTPAAALGSTRDKPDQKYCQKIFKVLKAHQIDTFFYIGGNDSSDTLQILSKESKKVGYPLVCIHIPKTIDNDLLINDHTPGYPSAAKFVSLAFSGINLDIKSLPGIYIGVVMGRHAGFLTAAASLGRKNQGDGPHLIYLPENNFNTSQFLSDVKKVYQKLGRCIVAVSEGVHDSKNLPIAEKIQKNTEKDAHGNLQLSGNAALGDMLAQLVRRKLKISRVRSDTLGYLQRSFLGCVSKVDEREAREIGKKALLYATKEKRSGSVVIKRVKEYGVKYDLVNLSSIAGKTRFMPKKFISADKNDITNSFIRYLRPLVGDDMPECHTLRSRYVKKIR